MTAQEYLEKYKDGYPSDDNDPQPINRFLYRNFEKKVIQISGSDGEADQ